MEQVLGPFKGYYVVCDALAQGARFAGEARIFDRDPVQYTDGVPLRLVRSIGAYDSQTRAMQAAEYQARGVIDDLPPCWDPFTTPGELGSTSTTY